MPHQGKRQGPIARFTITMVDDCRTTLLVLDDADRAHRLGAHLSSRGLQLTRTSGSSQGNSPAPHAIMVCGPEEARDIAQSVARLHHTYPDSNIVVLMRSHSRETTRAAFRNGAWDVLASETSDAELANVLIGAARSAPRAPRYVAANEQELLTRTRPAPSEAGTSPLILQRDNLHHDQPIQVRTPSAFLELLSLMRDARQRTDRVLALVKFDLDRFHECNERKSPAYGDRVLEWFRRLISQASRPDYVTLRLQSDQFATILPDVDEQGAIRFAETCRRLMSSEGLMPRDDRMALTATAGIVVSSPGCDETPHQLLQRARVVLIYGKQQGGNRVVTWSQIMNDPLSQALRKPESVYQASQWIARLRQHLRCMHMESTQALVAAIDARDPYTRTHSQTVASYAECIGRRMDFTGARLDALRAAALLHDIGKIGVPDAILTKPGPLTNVEFQAVKRHPETALDILRNVSFLADVQPMILHHHERFDGLGYPFELRGDQIPIGARIISVADALDTMLSPRTYKAAYSFDRVREELQRGVGGQFDPDVASMALRLMDEEPERFTPHEPSNNSRGSFRNEPDSSPVIH
jgi:diguanylate cyclase (GGDEF)-like protein/putative nucleotidyltransferase with HDIG domain